MTKQLYIKDTYLFENQTTITAQNQDERGSYILLDQTIFYPQGGGQPSDQGLINGAGIEIQIAQVRQTDNEVRHYVAEPINQEFIGQELDCVLNKERRLLNSRYHTAGHLLGNVVESLYPNLKAFKGHSFPNEANIEFYGTEIPDAAKIMDALKLAIDSNLTTTTFEIDPQIFEEKFYKLPYQIPGNKSFRAMQIRNYPPVPCGGTHLNEIGEIGSMTIGKIKEKNGVVRIAYELN